MKKAVKAKSIDSILNHIYYKTYDGISKLVQKAQLINPDIRYTDVRRWLDKQSVYQISKEPRERPRIHQLPIYSNQPNHFQIDIMMLTQYEQYNKGVGMILVCIDISSRYLFAFPIYNKRIEDIMGVMDFFKNAVEKRSGRPITALDFDNESALQSSTFTDWASDNDIRLTPSLAREHRIRLVDSVIRTLRKILLRHFIANESFAWLKTDILKDMVKEYNNSPHSSLKDEEGIEYTPKQVYTNPFIQNAIRQDTIDTYASLHKRRVPIVYEVGDEVRVQFNKDKFRKNIGLHYTPDIHVIERVNAFTVKLRDHDKLIHKDMLQKVAGFSHEYSKIEGMHFNNRKSTKLKRELNKLR
jgi:hypothetical protein